MAYHSDDAPVSLSNIVGIMGLFYLAILATILTVGAVTGGNPTGGNRGAAMPALDWTYASNVTA